MADAADHAAATRATSARTLLYAAGGCLLLGLAVASPAGAMAGHALAAATALAAALLARGRARTVAVALCIAALALAGLAYPDFAAHMAAYRGRGG